MRENGRRPLRLFFVLLGGLALFMFPGVFLNDEVAQAAGLTHLARGHLWTNPDLPDGYAPFVTGPFTHWSLAGDATPLATIGSLPLNLLALPVLLALRLVAAVTGVEGAILLLVASLVAGAVRIALSGAADPRARAGHWIVGVILLAGWPFLPALPSSPYLELASLQVVSMAATAFAAVLVQRTTEGRLGRQAGWISVILLLSSPAFFWASNTKYHALTLVPVAGCAYLTRHGPAERRLRDTGLAFGLAAVAVWNQPQSGAVLCVALAIAHLGWLRAGWRRFGAHAGVAVLAFAVALAPFLVQQQWESSHLGAPSGPAPPPSELASNPGSAAEATKEEVASGDLRGSAFVDPVRALRAASQVLFWTDWLDVGGPAMSWTSIAPWTVLGLASLLAWRSWRALGRPLTAFCGAYVAVLLLAGGHRLLEMGGGFDMRLAMTLAVPLSILATPWIDRVRDELGMRTLVSAIVAAALTVFLMVVLVVGVLGAANAPFTPQGAAFNQTAVHRYGGFALGVGLALTLLVRRLAPAAGRWSNVLSILAVSWAFSAQLLLQAYAAHSESIGTGQFVSWPIEVIRLAARWFLVQ